MSRDAESLGNSLTILRINFVEKLDHFLLNLSSGTTETSANVFNQVCSISFGHDFPEESSRLFEIIVGVLMRISAGEASHRELRLLLGRVLNWSVMRIGLIVRATSLVAVDGGGAISLIVGNSSSVGAVNGNLLIVSAESVSVSIGVREESSLEHLIGRGLNAWNNMGRSESRLLNLSEVVLRVLVEHNLANWNEWVILVRDNLGDIKNVVFVVLSLFLGNELNIPSP